MGEGTVGATPGRGGGGPGRADRDEDLVPVRRAVERTRRPGPTEQEVEVPRGRREVAVGAPVGDRRPGGERGRHREELVHARMMPRARRWTSGKTFHLTLPVGEPSIRVVKRTIFLPKLHRTVATEIRANEPGEDGRKSWRTVFSTEREVERQDWGTGKKWIEILGHNKSEGDLDRAALGLPVLENHDSRQHIGVGRNVRIEKKQLVAAQSFSGRTAGAELEQDVLDGIKGSTSVGYIPHSMKLVETRDDDVDVYRVTRWTPDEYSFFPLPAGIH